MKTARLFHLAKALQYHALWKNIKTKNTTKTPTITPMKIVEKPLESSGFRLSLF